MNISSVTFLVQYVLFPLLIVPTFIGCGAEVIQHDLHSISIVSEEYIASTRADDIVPDDVPRVLKKPKGTAKEPKSGKKPKSAKGLASSSPSSPPISEDSSQPSVSFQPTSQPSSQPSAQPSSQPSSQPSTQPSTQPTSQPSSQPTSQPSSQPSLSSQPSSQPSLSSQPTEQCAPISTQKDALLALKAGFTNGGTTLSNWSSDTEPCYGDWMGITCNSGRVTKIKLGKCNTFWLSIFLYYEMNKISSLGMLHKGGLSITGTISPLIGCSTTLSSSLTDLIICKYISDLHIFSTMLPNDVPGSVSLSHYLMFVPYFQICR